MVLPGRDAHFEPWDPKIRGGQKGVLIFTAGSVSFLREGELL